MMKLGVLGEARSGGPIQLINKHFHYY